MDTHLCRSALSRFGARLSTVIVPQNAYKTRILAAANIGYDPSIQGEFYKPFDGTQYFVAPQFFTGRTHFNTYVAAARQSDTRDRVSGAFYGGIGTWRFAQLRLGAEAGYDSFSRRVVVDGIRARSGGYAQPQVHWIFNHQDSGGLPSRGTRFEGSAGYLFRQTAGHPIFQSEYSTFQPLDRHVTVSTLSRAGTSFGRKLNYFDQFIAGDQANLSAFRCLDSMQIRWLLPVQALFCMPAPFLTFLPIPAWPSGMRQAGSTLPRRAGALIKALPSRRSSPPKWEQQGWK